MQEKACINRNNDLTLRPQDLKAKLSLWLWNTIWWPPFWEFNFNFNREIGVSICCKWKYILSSASQFQKENSFLKVPRLCSFALLVRATYSWRLVWSMAVMIRDNRSTQINICASAALSITNLTWAGLISSLGQCSEIPSTSNMVRPNQNLLSWSCGLGQGHLVLLVNKGMQLNILQNMWNVFSSWKTFRSWRNVQSELVYCTFYIQNLSFKVQRYK